MQEKQYLFYEKQSLAAFWKTSMLAEKIFLVCWSINAVLMAIIFAVLTPMATDRETAIFIFTLVWVLIFPGVLWISHRLVKAYWVIFKKKEVLRHGFYGQLKQKKKISYDEACLYFDRRSRAFCDAAPKSWPLVPQKIWRLS